MEREKHWQGVYGGKQATQVSWYAPHLERSLAMIRAVSDPSAAIIDVGGGASTLVDDLLALGYTKVSVLDVSGSALAMIQARLGDRGGTVEWITGDVTSAQLILATFSLEGPSRCSGLNVVRYSAEQLSRELGPGFALKQEEHESHRTPTGAAQKFIYCVSERVAAAEDFACRSSTRGGVAMETDG